jgi:hypothetical protein
MSNLQKFLRHPSRKRFFRSSLSSSIGGWLLGATVLLLCKYGGADDLSWREIALTLAVLACFLSVYPILAYFRPLPRAEPSDD